MRSRTSISLVAAAVLALLPKSNALPPNFANDAIDAMNAGYMVVDGSLAWYDYYYDNTTDRDRGWTLSQDIFCQEDAALRTGDADRVALVGKLLDYWIIHNPQNDWSGDYWNDDLAWYTQALIRGYQVTGNVSYIEPAAFGNDLVWTRGWNTSQCDGGIWETQPAPGPVLKPHTGETLVKLSLSTNSNAHVSCLLYQSTHNSTYLDRCKTIYNWTRTHLFNTTTGELWSGEYPDGTFDKGTPISDAGEWVDLANMLWQITGNASYYADAKAATDYAFSNIAEDHGIFSRTNPATFARGAGNFMRDNQLWDDYYDLFTNNSQVIIANREPTANITWNFWTKPTPAWALKNYTLFEYISSVAWLQYTPPFNPSNETLGLRTIKNAQTGLFIQSTGTWGPDQPVNLGSYDGKQLQRWKFTTNEADNNSYNLLNLNSWQYLVADNDTATGISQQPPPTLLHLDRWQINNVGQGLYSFQNKHNGLALDGGSSTTSGAALTMTKYTGATSQLWHLDSLPH